MTEKIAQIVKFIKLIHFLQKNQDSLLLLASR